MTTLENLRQQRKSLEQKLSEIELVIMQNNVENPNRSFKLYEKKEAYVPRYFEDGIKLTDIAKYSLYQTERRQHQVGVPFTPRDDDELVDALVVGIPGELDLYAFKIDWWNTTHVFRGILLKLLNRSQHWSYEGEFLPGENDYKKQYPCTKGLGFLGLGCGYIHNLINFISNPAGVVLNSESFSIAAPLAFAGAGFILDLFINYKTPRWDIQHLESQNKEALKYYERTKIMTGAEALEYINLTHKQL